MELILEDDLTNEKNKLLRNIVKTIRRYKSKKSLMKLMESQFYVYLIRECAKLDGLYFSGLIRPEEKVVYNELKKETDRINNIINPPREKSDWEKFMETR